MLDLLRKSRMEEVNAEVALVISNHDTLRDEAVHYGGCYWGVWDAYWVCGMRIGYGFHFCEAKMIRER